MEPDDTGLSSYYHQQQRHHQQQPPPPLHHQHQLQLQHQHQNPSPTTTATAAAPSVSNGIDRPPHMVYPHSVPSAVASPLETVRRKRGRPRKYGTPEQAAAAKRLSSSSPSPSSSSMPMSPPRKKEQSLAGSGSASTTSSKKSQLAALGNQGQGFAPHIISVAAGEDVGQKIMVFMQQSKREICILSASGAISNASLRQPATSGGNITYEGRYDILSLCGSYIRTELGGRTGGLSVCLASNDGQIIGGGVGGPLTAAGPVQVIVGTFLIDSKKDVGTAVTGDASTSKLPSPISGTPVSSVGFLSAIDTSGRIAVSGSDDHQNIGGSQFLIQSRGMQLTPPRSTDWRDSTDSRSSVGYDFSGRMGHGAHPSQENGDYDHFQD